MGNNWEPPKSDALTIVAHLRALGEGREESSQPQYGVCAELWVKHGVMTWIVARMGRDWPEKCENHERGHYPIAGAREYCSEHNKWRPETTNGAKRRRYCLWLADNWEKYNG